MYIDIIRSDCFDYLDTLPKHSIDCIITDPPYNITKCEWDRELDFDKMWELFWQVLKKMVVF